MSKRIIIISITIFLIYLCYLACSREFYYIKGLPITMYDTYVVVGRWYCGVRSPRNNYIKFAPFTSYPTITFHTAQNISICAPSDDTEINLKDYECICFDDPHVILREKYNKYKEDKPLLFSINLWWDFGTFFYQITYPDGSDSYRYIMHGGFWRWETGTIKSDDKE